MKVTTKNQVLRRTLKLSHDGSWRAAYGNTIWIPEFLPQHGADVTVVIQGCDGLRLRGSLRLLYQASIIFRYLREAHATPGWNARSSKPRTLPRKSTKMRGGAGFPRAPIGARTFAACPLIFVTFRGHGLGPSRRSVRFAFTCRARGLIELFFRATARVLEDVAGLQRHLGVVILELVAIKRPAPTAGVLSAQSATIGPPPSP